MKFLFRNKITLAVLAMLLGSAAAAGYTIQQRRDPLRRAETLLAAGDLRGAQIELRSAIARDPTQADAHLRMARLQSRLADPVAAEKEYRRAAALGAEWGPIMPEIGETILLQGRYAEVLKIMPVHGPAPAITARNLSLRAIAQIALNDVPGAAATLRLAQQAAPADAVVKLIAARVAAARNDLAATETNVAAALALDPNQIEALLMQQQLLTARGDRPAAMAIADRAVAAAPWSAMARIDRAYQLMFAGQDGRAQDDVDAVLAAQPRFIDALYLRGILTARRGDLTDAAAQLSRLDGVAARFPQVLFYQARIAQSLGQKETAAELARRYNTQVPNDPDGMLLMAQTAMDTGQAARALPVLRAAAAAGQASGDVLTMLGRVLMASGDRTAALEAFRGAAATAPDDPAVVANLGLAELQHHDVAEATALLEKASTMAPGLNGVTEGLVKAALLSGDIAKAQKALERLRASAGETEAVSNLSGVLRLRAQDPAGARAIWTAALLRFPDASSIRFNLALLLMREGNTAEAKPLLAQVLTRDPANVAVLKTYVTILAAANDMQTAIAALETAHKAGPRVPVITAMLADAWTATGNAVRAVTMLTDIQGGDAFTPLLLAPLARAQAQAGQLIEARTSFRRALAAAPGDAAARAGLVALSPRGEADEATLAVLQDGVTAAPGDIAAMTNLVRFTQGARGTEAALKAAEALRASGANMPYAAVLKGDLLMRLGRPADAADAYAREFDASPSLALLLRLSAAQAGAGHDDQAAASLRGWMNNHPDTPEAPRALAQLDIKARRFDDALVHLQTVLAQRPRDQQALNNLAWTYFLMGDARARAAAQQAYLVAPSPDTADTLGWIMFSEGAAKAAVPLLQVASTERPNDPGIRFHLGAALKQDGQTEAAATVLHALLDGGQDFTERGAAQKLLAEIDAKR